MKWGIIPSCRPPASPVAYPAFADVLSRFRMAFTLLALHPLSAAGLRPEWFLAALLLETAGAYGVHRFFRSRRRRALRRLAAARQMQYAEEDLFRLAHRIAAAW